MIILILTFIIILFIVGGIWGWPLLSGMLGISNATNKSSALKSITQLMHTYDITPSEVETAFYTASTARSSATQRSKSSIAKTLFAYLGAIFIFAGISTYIGTFWSSMGSTMRIFATLGVGYFLLIVLLSALHENKYPKLVLPLTLASAIMMTSGWFVFINELYSNLVTSQTTVLFIFGFMAVQLGALFSKYQHTVLAFSTLFFTYAFLNVGLGMLNVSGAYVAVILGASVFLVATALEKTPHRILSEPALLIGIIWMNSGLFERITMSTSSHWASLVIGVCVSFTAYGMQKEQRYPRLIAISYFIGSLMAYTGLFRLVQNTSVELLYLAVTASILYACVLLRSRELLLTTVIAMLTFIGYFSEKYFSNSLGWPITLILMGIIFLGIGAIAIKVKQRI